MFDIYLRHIIDPTLNRLAFGVHKAGITANQLTVIGFGFGILGAVCLVFGLVFSALVCLCLNRLCDGLDGSVARLSGTDKGGFGGYLDIVLDMLVYGIWPFAFAIGSGVDGHMVAACFLLVCYLGTASAFLALSSILSAKGVEADDKKSLIFGRGLAEGAETFAFMALICLVPNWFTGLCAAYGVLCLMTIAQRVHQARTLLN